MNPRESALPRPVAMRLAAAEYGRCAEMFRSLSPAQWAMPTDCPAWDVRQMAAHMLGMAEMAASIRENLRQQRKATKVAGSGGVYIDALTQPLPNKAQPGNPSVGGLRHRSLHVEMKDRFGAARSFFGQSAPAGTACACKHDHAH